jgi:hypothetical protein
MTKTRAAKEPQKNLRQLIKDAQRKDLHDEDPDRSIEHIASMCNINRAHLFDMMAGKPDPAKVKAWTLHRLSKGLEVDVEVVRAAVLLTRAQATRKKKRQSSMLD